MAPVFLPIGVEALQTQRQNSGGQIGITLALGQNQKPAVVDHKAQPPGSLAWRPPDFVLAGFGVRGGPTKGDQCHPLTIHFGHVAKGLPSQPGAMKIMLLLQQCIETLSLPRFDQADSRFAEKL